MHPTSRAYLYLHIAVFLWGVTAILGKLISFTEYVLVWYRMAIVALVFLGFKKTFQGLKVLPLKQVIQIGLVGILVAIHWIFFYGAIKYSNVSIALSAMATTSFLTALIEPLVSNRKFQWYEGFLGLLVIPGIYLIYHFTDAHHYIGILMALVSALFAALFSSFNKQLIEHTNSYAFSFVQISSGFVFLTLLLPLYLHYFPESWYVGSKMDYTYLVILSIFCTAVPMLFFFSALRKLNAFIANLTNNMEPVYGIILAWLIFRENQEMDMRFYIGSCIIIFSVFIQPLMRRRFER